MLNIYRCSQVKLQMALPHGWILSTLVMQNCTHSLTETSCTVLDSVSSKDVAYSLHLIKRSNKSTGSSIRTTAFCTASSLDLHIQKDDEVISDYSLSGTLTISCQGLGDH